MSERGVEPGDDRREQVQRDIDVTLPVDEVWPLVADDAGWRQWLVEEADVDIAPGGRGTVVDDEGRRRDVRVDEVVTGERVGWTWWPSDRPDVPSHVALEVIGTPIGSIVRITETRTTASVRWSACAGRLAVARALVAA